MSGLGYQQGSMWPHSQYPPTTQNGKNISNEIR
jgi:hypothetical protein